MAAAWLLRDKEASARWGHDLVDRNLNGKVLVDVLLLGAQVLLLLPRELELALLRLLLAVHALDHVLEVGLHLLLLLDAADA